MTPSDFSLLQDEEEFSLEKTPALPPQTPRLLTCPVGALRNTTSLNSVPSALIQSCGFIFIFKGTARYGCEVLREGGNEVTYFRGQPRMGACSPGFPLLPIANIVSQSQLTFLGMQAVAQNPQHPQPPPVTEKDNKTNSLCCLSTLSMKLKLREGQTRPLLRPFGVVSRGDRPHVSKTECSGKWRRQAWRHRGLDREGPHKGMDDHALVLASCMNNKHKRPTQC